MSPLLTKLTRSYANFNLKFRIIIPFVVLVALLVLVFVTMSTGTRKFSIDLILVVGVAMLAVVGLGLLLAWQIDRRIGHIISAAQNVAQGDFSVRLSDDHHDEIGHFVQTFNQMVIDLDHLAHSRDMLSRTMSPAVREWLIDRGLDFRGIAQDVSILFVDIRDFTRITEIYQADQLVFFLNDYYTTIANLVHASGGIIGKYGGDSILAFFGAPKPEDPNSSATAAILSALALQEALESLSERWQTLGLPPIRAGIGISFGSVIAGPIGSAEQFEYTIIGDPVNLASRLQDLTRTVDGFSIIISAETLQMLESRIRDQIPVISLNQFRQMSQKEQAKNLILFVDFGEVLVKGKQGPVHVYGIPDS